MDITQWLAEEEQDLLCHIEDSLRNGDFNMIGHVTEDCQCEGKQCTKCDAVKCVGAFGLQKYGKGKFCIKPQCKYCQAAERRAYIKANPERAKAILEKNKLSRREQRYEQKRRYLEEHAGELERQRQERRLAHLEKARAYSRQYHQSHREEVLRKNKGRYARKREQHRAYARVYSRKRRQTHLQQIRMSQKNAYLANREHYLNYQKVYRGANGEKIRTRAQAYYTREDVRQHVTHRQREYRHVNRSRFAEARRRLCVIYRARKREAGGTYTLMEWRSLCEKYDYTCLCCGRRAPEIKLTVDHVIPIILRGRNSIDNIQPLCLSCNSRKQAKIIDYRR